MIANVIVIKPTNLITESIITSFVYERIPIKVNKVVTLSIKICLTSSDIFSFNWYDRYIISTINLIIFIPNTIKDTAINPLAINKQINDISKVLIIIFINKIILDLPRAKYVGLVIEEIAKGMAPRQNILIIGMLASQDFGKKLVIKK